MHRPGLELSRLTPRNVGELLFDDVLWAGRAREEHDAFAGALRARGVRVHYYGQLLAETLEVPDGRAFVLDRLCVPETARPEPGRAGAAALRRPRRPGAGRVPGRRRAQGGPAPGPADSLTWDVLHADDFVLPPLPNHLFQRDNSCWIYHGVSVNPMAKPARQRESLHSRAIYRYHPMFAERRLHLALRRHGRQAPCPPRVEGGDVHVLGHGAVMIGMGERTTPMAVEIAGPGPVPQRAGQRGDRGRAPLSRAMMHLDTVMTMVDRGTFVLYPYLDPRLRSWTVTPDGRARACR